MLPPHAPRRFVTPCLNTELSCQEHFALRPQLTRTLELLQFASFTFVCLIGLTDCRLLRPTDQSPAPAVAAVAAAALGPSGGCTFRCILQRQADQRPILETTLAQPLAFIRLFEWLLAGLAAAAAAAAVAAVFLSILIVIALAPMPACRQGFAFELRLTVHFASAKSDTSHFASAESDTSHFASAKSDTSHFAVDQVSD